VYYYEAGGYDGGCLTFARAALYADPACMPGDAQIVDIDGDGDKDVIAVIYDTSVNKEVFASSSIFVFESQLAVPPQCGNGIIEPGEQCGEPGLSCTEPNTECNNCQCVPPVCGNGIKESGEQCEADVDCAVGFECKNCQCVEKPVVIDLVRFQAKGKLARIFLKWETASEIDTAGFNIYRADAEDGVYNKINMALIPAKGSATEGAAYKFVDWNVEKDKTYYYKLEDIDSTGKGTLHEPPVSAKAWFLLKGKGPKPRFLR
jgi:hypothetical protein